MTSPSPSDIQRARDWYEKNVPLCVGYPGKCDGDLVGEPHEPHCPCFGREPMAALELLASYASSELAELKCKYEHVIRTSAGNAEQLADRDKRIAELQSQLDAVSNQHTQALNLMAQLDLKLGKLETAARKLSETIDDCAADEWRPIRAAQDELDAILSPPTPQEALKR